MKNAITFVLTLGIVSAGYIFVLCLFALLQFPPGRSHSIPREWDVHSQTFSESPDNFANSESNFASNSSHSPREWDARGSSLAGNNRIIKDNKGNVTGYAVLKEGGGIIIYNNDGDRIGFAPSDN